VSARAHNLRVLPTPQRHWMTKQMLADHFGVCLSTIDNWRREAGLPEHRIGKVLRFDLLEVEAWVETQRRAG
jgi:Helix-turn-helix domain